MSTRVATSPMIARPTVSLRAFGAPLLWVEQLSIVFANEHAAENQAYLRRCTWALFPQGALHAACLPVGAVAVGLAARGLTEKRYNFCAGVAVVRRSNSLGLKDRAVDLRNRDQLAWNSPKEFHAMTTEQIRQERRGGLATSPAYLAQRFQCRGSDDGHRAGDKERRKRARYAGPSGVEGGADCGAGAFGATAQRVARCDLQLRGYR